MKKSLLLSAALATVLAASAFCKSVQEPETAPELEGSEKTVIIDASSVMKKFDDNVRLISGIDGNHTFLIRYYHAKKAEWRLLGSARLLRFADTCFVSSDSSIGRRRWIAVTSDIATECKFEVGASHNDLYIYVYPKDDGLSQETKNNAVVLDASQISGHFSDNVVLRNKTLNSTESFTVYAFADKSGYWSKVGYADFSLIYNKEDGEVNIDAPFEKVANFKYFAVVSKSGKSYSYTAKKGNNDFIITASEK